MSRIGVSEFCVAVVLVCLTRAQNESTSPATLGGFSQFLIVLGGMVGWLSVLVAWLSVATFFLSRSPFSGHVRAWAEAFQNSNRAPLLLGMPSDVSPRDLEHQKEVCVQSIDRPTVEVDRFIASGSCMALPTANLQSHADDASDSSRLGSSRPCELARPAGLTRQPCNVLSLPPSLLARPATRDTRIRSPAASVSFQCPNPEKFDMSDGESESENASEEASEVSKASRHSLGSWYAECESLRKPRMSLSDWFSDGHCLPSARTSRTENFHCGSDASEQDSSTSWIGGDCPQVIVHDLVGFHSDSSPYECLEQTIQECDE